MAIVFDRDVGVTVYVDGAARATAGVFGGDLGNTGEFLLGKPAGYSYFKGDLDEVAVYPSVLGAERVLQAHYAAGRG